METNLTNYQTKLINDLSKEFDKLNPKTEKVGTTSRFSVNTISECNNEEKKFIETIEKYNVSMSLVLDKDLKKQLKEFDKEYNKVMYLTYGKVYSPTNIWNDMNTLLNSAEKTKKSDECIINLVSKKNVNDSSDNRKYNNGMAYISIFLSYKVERVSIVLKSSKIINLDKIIGLNFSTHEWLHRNESYATNRNTLDLLIQDCKNTQSRIVYICR